MAAPSATTIMAKASAELLDVAMVRWTQADLLGYLNDGMGEIVRIKPDANTVNAASGLLVAGTKQALPAGGIVLMDVVRNLGGNGTTPGRAVTPVEMGRMDADFPDWHTHAAGAVARHFLHNKRDPKTYYVYPPQPSSGQGQVELVYSATPAKVLLAAVGNPIPLDEIYEMPLHYYLMFRAYSKNTKDADAAKAGGYYKLFVTALGQKESGQINLAAGDADGKPGRPQ